MKYIFCLIFLIQIKNCKSETFSPSGTISDNVNGTRTIIERNNSGVNEYLVNSVDQKAVGEKIQNQDKIKKLNSWLKNSFDREIERPYMWDIFVSSNIELLQYYHYKNFLINGTDFKAYYIKINYEDAHYQSIMLINEDIDAEYNALLIYEELDSEEKYKRYSEIKDDKIEVVLSNSSSLPKLSYWAKEGLFLDYFDEKDVNKKWGEMGKTNVSEYELKGKTSNHLKTGYWIEKKYSVLYNKNIIEDGNYINGRKNGEWNYSVEGPVDMIKTFDHGKYVKTSFP